MPFPVPMTGAAPQFLLTRPADQGARLAADLRREIPAARIVESPLLAPVFLRPVLPGGRFDAVIFTSETGVAAAVALGVPMPRLAYAVGNRTAAAAETAGFAARSAAGDAAALVALVRAERPGRVIHLRGADAAGEVAAQLVTRGIEAVEATVYRQMPQPLTPEARRLLAGSGPVLVPLFSPRTAALLATEAGCVAAPLWVAALSPAVAEAAAPLRTARCHVADRPDAASMLALLRQMAGALSKT